MQRSRPALLLTAAAAAATAIAACGSTSPKASTSPTAPNSPAARESASVSSTVTFSRCMRSHGVPNFPDLGPGGMRIGANGQTLSVNGVPVDAPAFETARTACQHYLPGVHATPAQTAQIEKQGLEFSRCMRSHGVPNFPDPVTRPGTGGNQEAYLPGVNLQSPAVQAGAKACGGFGPKGP